MSKGARNRELKPTGLMRWQSNGECMVLQQQMAPAGKGRPTWKDVPIVEVEDLSVGRTLPLTTEDDK